MSALRLEAVEKRFGALAIIRGVDLDIGAGEIHAVIGPNGAGKSTLFHLESGRLAPSAGRVLLEGNAIEGLAPERIARAGLARSFQVTSVFDSLSVFDNLRCALLWHLGHRYAFWRSLAGLADVRDGAAALAERIGLGASLERKAGELSYAEQRALEIGVTIAGEPRVILLDEPTAGMSLAETETVVGLLREVAAGRTLVMVEHDMGVVFDLADRISVLVHGRVVATDTPERIRANEAVQRAYLGDVDEGEGARA